MATAPSGSPADVADVSPRRRSARLEPAQVGVDVRELRRGAHEQVRMHEDVERGQGGLPAAAVPVREEEVRSEVDQPPGPVRLAVGADARPRAGHPREEGEAVTEVVTRFKGALGRTQRQRRAKLERERAAGRLKREREMAALRAKRYRDRKRGNVD